MLACQLYIEQEIKEGLAQGKTPHSTGKELTAMIERLFKTRIPQETIRSSGHNIKEKGYKATAPLVTPPSHLRACPNRTVTRFISLA